MLPLACIPLLREDGIGSSRVSIGIEMAETAEMLLNAVQVQCQAWFVPKLMFERFNGLDSFNRSYMGEPEADDTVIPFIQTHPFPATSPFYQTLGLHAPELAEVNGDYREAYTALWNWRARQRSNAIEPVIESDELLPAFWTHTQMKHVKPDYDQALIDGEIPLNIVEGKIPVTGIGFPTNNIEPSFTNGAMFESDGSTPTYSHYRQATETTAGNNKIAIKADQGIPSVFAEMQENGITVSLANIELAKQTAAFARMRQQYRGYDDDYLIDLMMRGIRLPDQAMKQPTLIASANTIMGMEQRYATDADNLDKSATRGGTGVDLMLRMPPSNTGGVIIITCEIAPEQLFERQSEPYLMASSVDDLPDYLADILDPEPVERWANKDIDVAHGTPDGTFGWSPLNSKWLRMGSPKIGGKFYRPDPNAAWDENRQRIWAVESVDPQLATDWYVIGDIHHNVFASANVDPFEMMVNGAVTIDGDTYFGPALIESYDDYDKVLAEVDQTRNDTSAPAADTEGSTDDE